MIFKSPHADVVIPDVPLTPFVFERAHERGEKPAIIDATTGAGWSYKELVRDIGRVAAGLRNHGLKRGDTVGILSPNDPSYPVAFHGVISAGGVATTMNPLYTVGEIANQLSDSRAKYLFCAPGLLEKAHEAASRADVREVFIMGDRPALADLMAEEPSTGVGIRPEMDLAALPYSSGTTGFAKGVMLTHRNLVANIVQSGALQQIVADDRVAAVLPFFHIYGMTIIMNQALWRGATVVSISRFEVDSFIDLLERQRITRLYAVPPIILAMLKHRDLDRRDLSALTHVLCGAAPLDAETAQACTMRIGVKVTQGYGLTETSPATHLTPDEGDDVAPGSIGYAVPNTECKLVDPDSGEELGLGGTGELWIRGPQVMAGYLNNPEATAATVDAGGFLHTGDVARIDHLGQWFIVDRLKELIKYKGFQIAPAELEAILISHPDIVDAAVIGIPDADAGEIPKGFVVTSGNLSQGAVMAYVAARVAPHKKLRRVEIVEEIPKAASGKILRRLLRDAETRHEVASRSVDRTADGKP